MYIQVPNKTYGGNSHCKDLDFIMKCHQTSIFAQNIHRTLPDAVHKILVGALEHDFYFFIYPLVNVYITMENHHFQWINPRTKWQCSMVVCLFTRGYWECHHPNWRTHIVHQLAMGHPAGQELSLLIPGGDLPPVDGVVCSSWNNRVSANGRLWAVSLGMGLYSYNFNMEGKPEIDVPLVTIHFRLGFSIKNHSAIGVHHHLWNPHVCFNS